MRLDILSAFPSPQRPLLRAGFFGALLSILTLMPLGAQAPAEDASSHDHSQTHGTEGHSKHHGADHGEDSDFQHHGMQHDFSNVERWVAIFDDPKRVAWQRPEEVVQLMQIEDGSAVADLGAGTGFFLPYLAAATPSGKVYGLDPEANLVQHMQQRVAAAGLDMVEVRHIGFDSPGLDAGSVDRILIVNTWHHIRDREVYSRKLLESLRPGGQLFIVDYTLESPSGPAVEHRLPPEHVISELLAGGFSAETIEESLPRQYIVVGTRAH